MSDEEKGMKISIARRRCWPTLLMGILILVASLVVAGPASATLTEYSYTGTALTDGGGGATFPSSPAIGDHVTISFMYDGPLPSGPTQIDNFVMSCGELQVSSLEAQASVVNKVVYEVTSAGLPKSWQFNLWLTLPDNAYYSIISDTTKSTYAFSFDEVQYKAGLTLPNVYLDSFTPGVWTATAVPLPSTLLLLGSGFLGLAGWRRFRRG
jgi:hypothetical protein